MEHVTSATVVAARGIDADVLAKVFNVLPPGDSIRLANSLAGVACLIVTRAGDVVKSDGWHRYEQPALGREPGGCSVPGARGR